jgi:hypothetical protein
MVMRGANYPRKPDEFYETPAETTRVLLDMIEFNKRRVVDPAFGNLAILRVLNEYKYTTAGSDLAKGYNFLADRFRWRNCDIVTNPPFGPGGRTAVDFIARALDVTSLWDGKIAMLLPVDFDSGSTRYRLFGNCPVFAGKIVLTNRIRWFNGKSGSTNHAWFVWDRTHQGLPWLRYAAQRYSDPTPSILT